MKLQARLPIANCGGTEIVKTALIAEFTWQLTESETDREARSDLANGETARKRDLLRNVQRFQSLKCEVHMRQLEELANYIEYVESATGEKPTVGEVVGAALADFSSWTKAFKSGKSVHGNPMWQINRGFFVRLETR